MQTTQAGPQPRLGALFVSWLLIPLLIVIAAGLVAWLAAGEALPPPESQLVRFSPAEREEAARMLELGARLDLLLGGHASAAELRKLADDMRAWPAPQPRLRLLAQQFAHLFTMAEQANGDPAALEVVRAEWLRLAVPLEVVRAGEVRY